MSEKEVAESINSLTSCLNKIYDNGCLFDNLVSQMSKLTEKVDDMNYRIDRLTKQLEQM